MGDGQSATYDRKKAIELKAADARALISSSLPAVLPTMTPVQLAQVQRVLDAAVVNPPLEKQYKDLMLERSAQYQDPNFVSQDPEVKRAGEAIGRQLIATSEKDKHIRLDYTKLLTPDALKPITDNTDEARYLGAIRNTLNNDGVWLRLDYRLRPGPDQRINPRDFEVWLYLGINGDPIPTKDGRLTREAILGTRRLGAGYYEKVWKGPIQSGLDAALSRIDNLISTGETWHEMEQAARDDHVVVHRVVDWYRAVAWWEGGGDFPSKRIWDLPRKLTLAARELNVHGNVKDASVFTFCAALATQFALQELEQYEHYTVKAGLQIVKGLTWTKKVAEAIGLTLMVFEVAVFVAGIGLVDGAAAGEALAARAVRPKPPGPLPPSHAPIAYARTNYAGPFAAEAKTIEKLKALSGKATAEASDVVGGGVDAYELAGKEQLEGWFKDVFGKAKELAASREGNPSKWGSSLGVNISGKELDALFEAAESKWFGRKWTSTRPFPRPWDTVGD